LVSIFSKHNDEPIVHSVVVTIAKKAIEPNVVTPLLMTSLSVTRLGECLAQEYNKCGQVRKVEKG
jgi:hypothetical protein